MKSQRAAPLSLLLLIAGSTFAQPATNPIPKVLQLITDLQAKIVKEGEDAQKVFQEFSEWCEDRAHNVGFEIKTGKAEVEDLKAAIASAGAQIGAASAKIEELAGSITADEADLTAATGIRAKETEDFAATEKDLIETVDILERAIGILEREARKGSKALLQVQKAGGLVKALTAMVEASMLNSRDADRLTALVQQQRASDEDGDDPPPGAPAAAAYDSHSGGIIEVLEDLLDKAKDGLENARNKETASRHNFEMLEQSLKDEIKNSNKELDEAKRKQASSLEAKASAEGEMAVTSKGLDEDIATQASLHRDCMEKSQDFEAETKSRGEELRALAEAKKAIAEATSGAEAVVYDADQSPSLLQLSGSSAMKSAADLANFEAVQLVRNLARREHSTELALLAKRMAAAMRSGVEMGTDPFAKVKALIKGMIEKLLSEGGAEASHKAYCDKEMAATNEKLENQNAAVEKLNTEIDVKSAKSAQLKEDVAALQRALAELASAQASMDKIRAEEREVFARNKADTEQGLEGVKMALKILREYYAKEAAHESATGAANGIIGMLEVVESDLTKSIAESSIEEQTAQNAYEQQTQENKISRVTKESSVEYKTKEFHGLDLRLTEAASDLETEHAELQAVQEYDAKIKEICIAKPETFSERKRRREEEIAGLKEALQILEGEAVLLQGRAFGLRGGAATANPRAAVRPHAF